MDMDLKQIYKLSILYDKSLLRMVIINDLQFSVYYYRHSPAKLKHWSLIWPDLDATQGSIFD